MKRMTYFVMALALVLGFTQCKKESIEPQNEGGVRITLNVENSGNRHAVDTELGTVDYQDGDVIYVGDGSHFIGTLTRENGTFSGTINPTPADEAQIHFYFLGGLTPSVTPEAGSTSDFTVNISDQTSKLPVLSYEHTTYYEGTTEYSCELKNKCGLVRFPLANEAGSVKVSGMHTEATISFNGTPGITPTDATGQVSLYSVSNTEKWAILLPQGRVTDAYLQGVQVDVPQVTDNIRIVSIPTIGNPEPITWDGQIISQINVYDENQSYEHNGITVSGVDGGQFRWNGIVCSDGPLYFTSTSEVGNITKIEIFYNYYEWTSPYLPEGSAWSINGDEGSVTWEGGPTTSVTLEEDASVMEITQIVFTVEAAAPAPTPTEPIITWDGQIISLIDVYDENQSYKNNGITVSSVYGGQFRWSGIVCSIGPLCFSSEVGKNITKIEIFYNYESDIPYLPGGSVWSIKNGVEGPVTWEGNPTTTVMLETGAEVYEITQIVFTVQQ